MSGEEFKRGKRERLGSGRNGDFGDCEGLQDGIVVRSHRGLPPEVLFEFDVEGGVACRETKRSDVGEAIVGIPGPFAFRGKVIDSKFSLNPDIPAPVSVPALAKEHLEFVFHSGIEPRDLQRNSSGRRRPADILHDQFEVIYGSRVGTCIRGTTGPSVD